MNPANFFSYKGKLSRKHFTLAGLVLFAFKYNIDRLVAASYERSWFVTDYFIQPDHLSVTEITESDYAFYVTLLLVSLPFMVAGVFMCLRRLTDAGMPRYLVFLFFVPFINILFFFLLCLFPADRTLMPRDERPRFADAWIPRSRTGSMLFAVGITLLISVILAVASVNLFREYGWGLFVGLPFFIGFSSVLLYAYHHHPIRVATAMGIGVLSVLLFALILFFLAMEGLICIAIAVPLAIPIGFLGALMGYAIQSYVPRSTLNGVSAVLLVVPGLMWLEKDQVTEPPLYALKTGLVVEAPPELVWQQLVAFSRIDPPTEWIFKTGIAYPTHAEIEGTGVGAIRRCNFTTGPFVEPITVWNEPSELAFDVAAQPQPMLEYSVYDRVEAVHLDGYFVSEKGQFKLTRLARNRTLLEGTTWYRNKMWPLTYWKPWSDEILHQIHGRVLRHIRQKAEEAWIQRAVGSLKPGS